MIKVARTERTNKTKRNMVGQLLKIFFGYKGIGISIALLLFLRFAGKNYLYFSERSAFHGSEYDKTLAYYSHAICQDNNIKAQTEGKNKCDEYAVFLTTSPNSRAIIDTLDHIFLCDAQCSRWVNLSILVFGLGVFALIWCLVKHTAWSISKYKQMTTDLPFFSMADLGKKQKKYE